jgi:NADH-quinone oxidoreductase subunit C
VVDLKVDAGELLNTIRNLKEQGYDYLVKITAVDYNDHIDAVYIVRNIEARKTEVVEVKLPAKSPKLPSIMEYHEAADWYERELSEMFGIKIRNRAVRRLLLEKWDGEGAPLRKDFEWGAEYEAAGERIE